MRKLTSVLVLFGLLWAMSGVANAAITNRNLDAGFEHHVVLQFGTEDIGYDGGGEISLAGNPSATNTDQVLHFVAPTAGTICAMSVRSNAALTAGWATFDVTINGTANTSGQVALMEAGSKAQSDYTSLVDRFSGKGSIAFNAGDRIGVRMRSQGATTGSSVSPAAPDVVVGVVVGLNQE